MLDLAQIKAEYDAWKAIDPTQIGHDIAEIDGAFFLVKHILPLLAEVEKARNPLVTREGDTMKDFARVIKERDDALLQVDEIKSSMRRIADELWEVGSDAAQYAATEIHGIASAIAEGRLGAYSRK